MGNDMQIGFSQRIQLEWLERTAGLVLAAGSRAQVEHALQGLLAHQLSIGGTAQRGNREKAITILLKIWVTPPRELLSLRDDGLALVRSLPPDDHLAVHWGMTMAVYPFFGVVADTVGRLLRLQGTVSAAQVQRRLREQLGERDTVARAARRILRCFIDWGVIEDTQQKGVYSAECSRLVLDLRLAAWLVEAALVARDADTAPLKAVVQSPALFPFSFRPITISDLQTNGRLETFRQGLDEDMVTVRAAKSR